MKRLSENLIREISEKKKEPKWMLEFRLKALEIFKKKSMPLWGADLSGIDFSKISYFDDPKIKRLRNWNQAPEEMKQTFVKLGIPKAERRFLGGVGVQWDSGVIYQKLKKRLEKKGVIFCDIDEAVIKYPRLIKKYFMGQCVDVENNKFAALHGAVWSGGSFVYVPKGVKIKKPLQGFFWMNEKQGGQFEHTLIIAEEKSEIQFIEGCTAPRYKKASLHAGVVEIFVEKKAKVRYTTVQNWSKDVYNLATKRAVVGEEGIIEWVSGSLGSKTTMLYPCSVLKGKKAKADYLSLSLAGKGQELDIGAKVIHVGEQTKSNVISKSISKNGGRTIYRGLVKIAKGAKKAKSSVNCEALLMDDKSKTNTYPYMEIEEDKVIAIHEAKTGKIAEEELFYLMSRGLSEKEAIAMIINGFIEPIVKQLPIDYAVEMNRLIELEMEGNI